MNYGILKYTMTPDEVREATRGVLKFRLESEFQILPEGGGNMRLYVNLLIGDERAPALKLAVYAALADWLQSNRRLAVPVENLSDLPKKFELTCTGHVTATVIPLAEVRPEGAFREVYPGFSYVPATRATQLKMDKDQREASRTVISGNDWGGK